MLDDFDQYDPRNTEFYASARVNFTRYVLDLLDEEQGINLRDGWVPCTHRWLVTPGGAVVGVTRLRHRIDTPFLLQQAGHVGYDVAPSHRGQGYGHIALRVAMEEAALRCIPKILIYTAEANNASRAIIERGGGALESIAYSDFWKERECRYWISVRWEG